MHCKITTIQLTNSQNNAIFVKPDFFETMKMKIHISRIVVVMALFIVVSACKEKKNEDAIKYLDNVKILYQQEKYKEALLAIDSLQILYPKAFPEIKEGLVLKQDVRKAYDTKQIADCDSLMATNQPKIDSIKKLFVYRKDKEDEKGTFIPKTVSGDLLTTTMMRAGVEERGDLYIESVFIGGQYHNVIQAKAKNGSLAQTKPIDDEGFSFRFSHMGKQYEILRAGQFHDNGLVDFILENNKEPITIILKGKNSNSFSLANIQKKAIVDSYNLSKLILQQDSLSTAREKATYRIKYVDEQKQKSEALKEEQTKLK